MDGDGCADPCRPVPVLSLDLGGVGGCAQKLRFSRLEKTHHISHIVLSCRETERKRGWPQNKALEETTPFLEAPFLTPNEKFRHPGRPWLLCAETFCPRD